jgi:Na+/H+ antiporter NhaD/arsenite permease-like protein
MIAVMIMGRGIAEPVLWKAFHGSFKSIRQQPSRIVAVTSAVTGLISGIIQNIGSAALILPSILSISRSRKYRLPL